MPLDLSTLDGMTPYMIKTAFQKIQAHANHLEAQLAKAHATLAAQPPLLTLDQIRAALSATGSHPLNLVGLIGTPEAATSATSIPPAPPP